MPADWIVDKVFAVSPPKNLQRIACESGEFSFSPTAFARLLDLAADSLEKLAFTPPISATVERKLPLKMSWLITHLHPCGS